MRFSTSYLFCDWRASQADGLKVYDDNGMHLELGILMQPGKHVRGTKSMELLSQSFWPSFLKPAKLFESMAPQKQVQGAVVFALLRGLGFEP